LAAFAARTAESANITDEVSPPGSIYNPVVLAVAQLLDQISPAGSIYNAPVFETGTATVVLRRAKLNAISSNSFGGTGGVTTSLTVNAVLSPNVYGGIQASAVALELDAEISGGTATAVVSGNQASGTAQSGQITATVLTSTSDEVPAVDGGSPSFSESAYGVAPFAGAP
jgi:hypothetical protein